MNFKAYDFIFTLLLSLGIGAAQAAPPPQPIDGNSSLKEIMDEIGSDFKAINTSSTDRKQDGNNTALAGDMAQMFTLARNKIPELVQKMPAKDQPEATKEFQS